MNRPYLSGLLARFGDSRSPSLLVLALTALALGLVFRFASLDSQMYSHDEAYTSLRAAGYTGSEAIDGIWNGKTISREDIQLFLRPNEEKDVFDTLSAIARSEPQLSPLYFVIAHYWMRWIGSSQAAMRGLAALLSIFAIPGMYWLCTELFRSRRTALVSAALISLSPFSILLAQDGRPYSLWASVTLLSSAVFMIAIRRNRAIVWGAYLFSIVVGIYSHQMFVLVIIAHGLYLFTVRKSCLEGRFIGYLVAAFLAALAFTPWLLQLLTRWDFVMARIDVRSTQVSLLHIQRWITILASPFIDLYLGPGNIVPYILRVPVLLLMGYAFAYLLVSTPSRVWAFLVLLIGVTALPMMLSDLLRGGILSIQGRYYVGANVAIIPVMAHLLVQKLTMPRASPPPRWCLVTALLLAAQLGSALNIMGSETWWTKKLSWIDPQIGHVLNLESHPLLIVNGLAPTDLGDVLALSYMADQDVSFRLYRESAIVEPPSGFSNIFWFHQTYWNFLESEGGRQFHATEVVPYFLWRLDATSVG